MGGYGIALRFLCVFSGARGKPVAGTDSSCRRDNASPGRGTWSGEVRPRPLARAGERAEVFLRCV